MPVNRLLSALRIVFVNNGYWKLLSLIISVLIYFPIRSDISHVRVVSVPVETDMDTGTDGAAIWSIEPRSVQVTLRGSYSEVSQLAASTLRCVVRPKQKKICRWTRYRSRWGTPVCAESRGCAWRKLSRASW